MVQDMGSDSFGGIGMIEIEIERVWYAVHTVLFYNPKVGISANGCIVLICAVISSYFAECTERLL